MLCARLHHIPAYFTTLTCIKMLAQLISAGVNSFKMFQAYKDVFMLRDDEVRDSLVPRLC